MENIEELRAVAAWLALPVETWPYEVLQAWQKVTLPLVQAMANAAPIDGMYWHSERQAYVSQKGCAICRYGASEGHAEDCPVIPARILLAGSEASK